MEKKLGMWYVMRSLSQLLRCPTWPIGNFVSGEDKQLNEKCSLYTERDSCDSLLFF